MQIAADQLGSKIEMTTICWSLLIGLTASLCLGRCSVAQSARRAGTPVQEAIFRDVPAGHWASEAVNDLAVHGVFTGYPDQLFHPNRGLSRYEFAVAIQRLFIHPPQGIPSAPPS